MERITGKQVQSMMEALNHVYAQPEVEQLDEASESTGRGAAARANRAAEERARVEADRRVQAAGGGAAAEKAELERLRKANVRPQGPGSQRWRPKSEAELTQQARYTVRQRGQEALKKNPDFQAPEKANAPAPSKPKPKPGENTPPKPAPAAQTVTAKNASGQQQQVTVGRKYEATLGGQKGTVTYDAAGKRTFTANKPVAGDTAPAKPTGNTAADKTTTPPAKPVPTGTTADGTKFERRLPTMAELRAAQAARLAAKKAGADRAGQEAAAVKGGVSVQKSIDASIKAANRPEVLNRPAPAGSALRAQQDRLAAQKAATTAANTTTAANKLSGSGALAPTGAKPVPTTTSTSAAPKPVGTPIQGGVKPVAGAPTGPAASTKFGTAPAPKPAAAAPAPKPAPKPVPKPEPKLRDKPLW